LNSQDFSNSAEFGVSVPELAIYGNLVTLAACDSAAYLIICDGIPFSEANNFFDRNFV
jgi:hypothetical protein